MLSVIRQVIVRKRYLPMIKPQVGRTTYHRSKDNEDPEKEVKRAG
jgi:hypothetical protein